jgi:acetyltransferase-like isoleucine patch superfamily enzyme
MFTNDIYPRAVNDDGTLQTSGDWNLVTTRVKSRASIGSNATILAGVTIGEGAMVVASRRHPRRAGLRGREGVPARVTRNLGNR